jgi:hypothetical protein
VWCNILGSHGSKNLDSGLLSSDNHAHLYIIPEVQEDRGSKLLRYVDNHLQAHSVIPKEHSLNMCDVFPTHTGLKYQSSLFNPLPFYLNSLYSESNTPPNYMPFTHYTLIVVVGVQMYQLLWLFASIYYLSSTHVHSTMKGSCKSYKRWKMAMVHKKAITHVKISGSSPCTSLTVHGRQNFSCLTLYFGQSTKMCCT